MMGQIIIGFYIFSLLCTAARYNNKKKCAATEPKTCGLEKRSTRMTIEKQEGLHGHMQNYVLV